MFLSSLEDVKQQGAGLRGGRQRLPDEAVRGAGGQGTSPSLLKAKAYADAVREAMARDLRIAREIQMGILPADLAAATKGPGSTCTPRSNRPVRSAAIFTRCCGSPTSASSSPWVMCRERESRRRCSWRSRSRCSARWPGRSRSRTRSCDDSTTSWPSRTLAACSSRCSVSCSIWSRHACRVPAPGTTSLRFSRPARPPRLAFPSSGRPGRAHAVQSGRS